MSYGYLQQYFNGNAGMFFNNGNFNNWYANNYSYAQTNPWGEILGTFLGCGMQIAPTIFAASRASKQDSTTSTVDYDAQMTAKKTEITTALTKLGITKDFTEIKDSTTAEDLLPSSLEDKITSTNETLTAAKNATDTAQNNVDANNRLIEKLKANETAGTITNAEKTQLENAEAKQVSLKRALTDAQEAEDKAKKALEAAEKAKNDKKAAIEAALPNIKKLVGEYNDLETNKNNTAKAKAEAESKKMTEDAMNQKSYSNTELQNIWDDKKTDYKQELSKNELKKAYATAVQKFIKADDNSEEKALWAHRAVNIVGPGIRLDDLSSNMKNTYHTIYNYAQNHEYKPETPQPAPQPTPQ